MKESILREFNNFIKSGAQYRENATYIESVKNGFTEKTDSLKSAVDEIAAALQKETNVFKNF